MPPFTWRSRLDIRRRSTPPAPPPEGTDRFWSNASGELRKVDSEGTDSAAGGSGGDPGDLSELTNRVAALEARPRGSVGPG